MREHEEHDAAFRVRRTREWREGVWRVFFLLRFVGRRMLRRRVRLPLGPIIQLTTNTNRYPTVRYLC
jgi:translation initiation factor IF-3